jgi:hypothetical protein
VGVSSALDFISLEPSDYSIVTFAVEPSGPEDQSLSLIQVKKKDNNNSLISRLTLCAAYCL